MTFINDHDNHKDDQSRNDDYDDLSEFMIINDDHNGYLIIAALAFLFNDAWQVMFIDNNHCDHLISVMFVIIILIMVILNYDKLLGQPEY